MRRANPYNNLQRDSKCGPTACALFCTGGSPKACPHLVGAETANVSVVLLLNGGAAVFANAQDAAASSCSPHSGDKAALAAIKLEEILAKTQACWAQKHADDIVAIARESRTPATSRMPPELASSIKRLSVCKDERALQRVPTICILENGKHHA